MTNEIKERLYVTSIVIVMTILYVGPLIVSSQYSDVESAFRQSCYKEFPTLGFDFCLDEARRKAEFPFWKYLLPFFPTAVALWLNWLIKPDMRLNDEIYPKRTINALMWFGLLAAALAIWLPFSEVVSRDVADLHKIQSLTFWRAPWIVAAWLAAPMLFHHLLAPVSLAGTMQKGKIALWLLAATPIASYALYVIRESIKI